MYSQVCVGQKFIHFLRKYLKFCRGIKLRLNRCNLCAIFSFDPQVSEEAPTFATDSKFGDLLVVVVPRQGPRIVGAHERFFINVHDNVMTV